MKIQQDQTRKKAETTRRQGTAMVGALVFLTSMGCGPSSEHDSVVLVELDERDMVAQEDQEDRRASEDMSGGEDVTGEDASSWDMEEGGCLTPVMSEEPIRLGAGRTVTVSVPAEYEVVSASGAGLAVQVGDERDGATSVDVRALYVPGEKALDIEVVCKKDEAKSVVTQRVMVEQLELEVFENWGDANGPVRREHSHMFTHPDDPGAVYVQGGYAYRPQQFTFIDDMWRFDRAAGTWSEVAYEGEAPISATGRLVYAPDRGVHYVVGGYDLRNQIVNTGVHSLSRDVEDDSWRWQREDVEGELAQNLGALFYDGGTLYAVLGYQSDPLRLIEGVSAVDLSSGDPAWAELEEGDDRPSRRYGFASFRDERTGRFIVTGGARSISRVNVTQDTWAYDPETMSWQELVVTNKTGLILGEPTLHSGARNACWAYDPVHRRLFVWGGTTDGQTTSPGLFVLHLLDDEESVTWYEVEIDGLPPARTSCNANYSAALGEIFFGFGNGDSGVHQDLVFLKVHEPIME